MYPYDILSVIISLCKLHVELSKNPVPKSEVDLDPVISFKSRTNWLPCCLLLLMIMMLLFTDDVCTLTLATAGGA